MVTVQDLINAYRKAQQYEYSSITTRRVDGFIERHSNVNNLVDKGGLITFTSTVDIRDIFPDSIPSVHEIEVLGTIIERTKRTQSN